jgi:outer membrane protein assembly factor BamB
MIRRIALLSACLAGSAVSVMAGNWPQFRGPNGDNTVTETFPHTWDPETNIRWQFPTPGEGWSAPIVWGNRVFLTAAIPDPEPSAAAADSQPAPAEGRARRNRTTSTPYRWEVMCLDAASGEVLWRRVARTGLPPIPRHSSNTFATETPVTDGERVYAYFGMTGLYCYDLEGNPIWDHHLGTYKMRADWGTASSPLLFEGRLYLQIDNEEQSFLAALDTATGKELWRVNREEHSQYCTPYIWKNRLRTELVTGGQVCRSYDPATGELLWQLDLAKGRGSASPVGDAERLYVGTELRDNDGADDGGGFLFAVRAGAAGDITPASAGAGGASVAWVLPRSGLQMASPVICAGHLYLLERRSGILRCVNAETGKLAYVQRLEGSRAFWSTPWVHEDKVFCLDDRGTTHVIQGGPEFRVLTTNTLPGQFWSTAAIADGALYLRSTQALYCIAESP